jgi:methionyl-tRNA synthetase
MSKSLGNVADPLEFIEKYGVDALRYYLLKEISPFADGDFAEKKLVDLYNSDLANGLGNLVSRVAKLCENSGFTFKNRQKYEEISPKVKQALNEFKFDEALKEIWFHIKVANETINETEPWKKNGEELKKSLTSIISFVEIIIPDLKPLLPETAEKIETQFEGSKIKSSSPLFPRIN